MVSGRGKLVISCFAIALFLVVGTWVSASGQIKVTPVTAEKEVPPDEFVSLVFSVANDSGVDRNVEYELNLPDGWTPMGQPASALIPSGEKESVFVTVQVPSTAKAGEYAVELEATYDSNTSTGEASVTVKGVKGVELTAPDTRTTKRKTELSYEFTVTNTGNIADTFYLEARSGNGWVEEVSPEKVQLFPGSSKKIIVDLYVPEDAQPGRDPLTVGVVSARDDDIADERTVYTRVLPPSPRAVGGNLYAVLPASLEADFSHDVDTGNSSGTLNLTADGDIGYGNLYLDFGLSDIYTENTLSWNALDFSEENFKVSTGDVGYSFSDLVWLYGRGISASFRLGKFDLYLIDLTDGLTHSGGSLTYRGDEVFLAGTIANLELDESLALTESVLGIFNPTESTTLELEADYTPAAAREGGAFRAYGEFSSESWNMEGEAFYIGTGFAGNDRGDKGFRVSQNFSGEHYSEELYYSYLYEPPEGVQTESSVRRSRLAASLSLDLLGLEGSENSDDVERDFTFSGFAEFASAEDTGKNPVLDETVQRAKGSFSYLYENIELFLTGTGEIRTNRLAGESFSYSRIDQGIEYTLDGILLSAEITNSMTKNLTSNEVVSNSSLTNLRLETLDSPSIELAVTRTEGTTSFSGEATVSAAENLELTVSGSASSGQEGFSFSGNMGFEYDFDMPLKFLVTKGRVEGYIFVDENGDGERNSDEEGVEGLVLTIEDTKVASGKDGYFKFPPLLPGTYELELQDVPQNLESTVELPREVKVARGRAESVGLPLNRLGEVRVEVYEDENQNGKRENRESGVGGLGVLLSGPGGERRRTSDSTGEVTYQGLSPGEYTLTVDEDTIPPRTIITTENKEVDLKLAGGQVELIEIGTYQEPREIIFGQPPKADFLYAPLTPDPDTVVNFSGGLSVDPDGEITDYSWDFQSDGEVDREGKIVSYNFGAPGTYEVLLTVTDDEGNEASTSKRIEVVEDN